MGLLGKMLGRPSLGRGGLSYAGIGDVDVGGGVDPIFSISGLQGLWDISETSSLNGGDPVGIGDSVISVADLTVNGNDLTAGNAVYQVLSGTPFLTFDSSGSLFGWAFGNTLGTFFFVSPMGIQIIEVNLSILVMPGTLFAAAGFINRAPSTLTPEELSIINNWLSGRFVSYADGVGSYDGDPTYIGNYYGYYNFYGFSLADADDTGTDIAINGSVSGLSAYSPPWTNSGYDSGVSIDSIEPFTIVFETIEDAKVLDTTTNENFSKVYDLTTLPNLIIYRNFASIIEGAAPSVEEWPDDIEAFSIQPYIQSICGPLPHWWLSTNIKYIKLVGNFHGILLDNDASPNTAILYFELSGRDSIILIEPTDDPPDFSTLTPNIRSLLLLNLNGLQIPIVGSLDTFFMVGISNAIGNLPTVNVNPTSTSAAWIFQQISGLSDTAWDSLAGTVGGALTSFLYNCTGTGRNGILSIDPDIPQTVYTGIGNILIGFSGAYPELLQVLTLTDCGASEATVDAILAAAVTTPYTGSGTPIINLDGTNAAPSVTGAANKAILQGLGYTVNTN